MDVPESPVNRIGRTIWTVWGYLSGAVARYLRPEVTDEGNQRVCSRSDQIDLSAAKKINREVKANNSEKEEKKSNQNDKSTGEVKCSLAQVKVQVASVQWEKTDVVKDDKNDELNVDTARKQTYSCAMWSAETDHEGSISGDSESRGCKSGTHVEKEVVSSDKVQAERVYANIKDSEIVQELDEIGRFEQKDGNNDECDQKYEDEKCEMKSEDPDNADVTVQSELYGEDVQQEKEIMMDHGETETSGGFEHAGFIGIMEKETVGLKERVETEIDEDQGPELQVPGDVSEEDTDGLSNPERLKVMEKYFDEIAEFCKEEVEEMIPEDRGATVTGQDTIKSELQESAQKLQTISKAKTVSNIETEMKMTVNASEDSLLFDSKQDTPENTSETGTGLPVVMAIKTEGMFSYPIVCEFPGESRKRPETALGCLEEIKTEPQSLAEEQAEKETFVTRSVEHPETQKAVEIEPPIETVGAIESQTHQEIDDTKFSLKKHVEFKTELIVETTDIKISSEDEEAEPYETQSQSSNIRNVTLQTRELLEFTERESNSSQESPGNSGVSEITGIAEIQHVAEDQRDAEPVLIQTLGPAEFSLDLQGESEQCIEEQDTRDTDVAKIALEYVEEITNQVLKDMIEMENNLVKETETLEGVSTEELGDAESQGPEECVSVGAFVLEEERKLLGDTMGSIMEVETTSREVAIQSEQDIISQEGKTTEADQQTYLCAGTAHGGSGSWDTESDTQEVSSGEGQAERVHANSWDSEIVQELDETGRIEQKDGNNDEYDQRYEDENCSKMRDPDNADVTVQSELYGQDVEQEKEIMMDHGETETSGGFEHAGFIDEMEKENVGLKERVETEIDEDQGLELQVPGDASDVDGLSNPERLNVMEKCFDENAEFCKEEVEEMIPENRGATESVQDTIKSQESWDTESDTHVENEEVSSGEGQAERVYANIKDSEIVQELDENGRIEQKDGNNEEYDQKYEDEKCEMKSEDPDNANVTVQSELYGQDVEQEKEIMMDHGETETSGGFEHAGFIDEMEKENVGLKERGETEIDEDQGPELQVPGDASEEDADGLSNPKRLNVMEKCFHEITEFCKNEVEEMIPENRGATESEQDTIKSQESWETESDTHVENEEDSSSEGQAERGHAEECKERETALELDKTGQIEQKDDNDEECDQNHEDEKCEMKSEDPDVTVQSELYRQDVEQEKQMIMMDHETESSGGFRYAGEHLNDEREKNIVDQNDHEKAEIEDQVPADAFVLKEGRKLLEETMEVENAVKHTEPQSSPECERNEADGRHDQIHKSSGHEDFMEVSRPGMKRGFNKVNKDPPVVKIGGAFDLDLQAFEDSSLDFSVQKSRIAVKNPLVRPPKDPRKLLFKISVEPRLPQPPACEVSAPGKGVIGFKLPGLGAGLPALRKTEFGKKAREEAEAERTLHPQLKSVAVTEDSVKQEPASAKPKWTPPKHPGMGSPLMMAELRNKLKKPVKE